MNNVPESFYKKPAIPWFGDVVDRDQGSIIDVRFDFR